MRKMNRIVVYVILASGVIKINAGTKNDPHFPISHCYHWLDEQRSSRKFLTYKYRYADQNNGDFAFVAGMNGAAAGPGTYCAKSPSGSYTYGDRVIRIDLVDDIVLLDDRTKTKYCGHNGNLYPSAQCNQKPWDIKFYSGGGVGNYAWYVIKDPSAIARWSASSDQLIADLNASKALNPGGISTHFDKTINAINAERARLGEKTYINHNARMSILTILTRPELLRQVPALTVISKVQRVPSRDFSNSKKMKVYTEQFERSISDSFLTFKDYEDVFELSDDIKEAFVNVVKKLDDTKLKKANIPVIMLGMDKYSSIDNSLAQKLWNLALSSDGPLQIIVDENLDPSSKVMQFFEYALLNNIDKMDQVKAHNQVPVIKLLDMFAKNNRYKDQYSKIIEDILIKALSDKSDTVQVIKSMTNPNINKDKALKNALAHYFPTKFKGLDLITVGQLTDIAKLDTVSENKYHQLIQAMEIPNDKNPTYILLDDFTKEKIKLPSMITQTSYLSKLMDRALKERGKKGMTNFYRFVLSDIFEHFYSKIKKEDDDTKKTALYKDASDLFYKLLDKLSDEQFKSYGYILTQNAVSLANEIDYDDHPIETAYDKYKSGDTAFDTFFEKVAKYALEGSFLQFIIRKADDDQKAKDLLNNIIVPYALSPQLTQWMASNEFKISQEEKEEWKNVIDNRFYTRRGSFVSSDICHFSKVIYLKKKYLKKILSSDDHDKFQDLSTDLYKSDLCK